MLRLLVVWARLHYEDRRRETDELVGPFRELSS
jgi:hypothetical protein